MSSFIFALYGYTLLSLQLIILISDEKPAFLIIAKEKTYEF